MAVEPPNRRIACAGAVAAGLHLLLFLVVGVSSTDSRRPSSAPEINVYVESQDRGRDAEHDRAGPVEVPAAPAVTTAEELLSSAEPSRASGMRSQAAVTRTVSRTAPLREATPPEPAVREATPAEPAEGVASSAGDLPFEAAAVLTTTGASERSEVASAAPVVQPTDAGATVAPAPQIEQPPAIDIPAAQQSLLSRWVMQAVTKVDDSSLRQGRLSLQHEGRRYVASFERRPAADSMDIERMTVEITTEENGRRLRTQLELKRLAFSHFAQLVDWWDPDVQFHDDQIVGRFHSNSQINVGYDRAVAPRFLAAVTTAAAPGFKLGNAEGYRRNDDIFRGGLTTRAARIALPRLPSPPPAVDQGEGGTQSRWFTRDTRITFYADGSYGWRELAVDGAEHRQIMGSPTYVVGAHKATLYVRGTVRGKVLVYSPTGIVVEGSLGYARDPRRTADADDYLGLLSAKDIEIAPPRVTGPGDLEIDAAVYARRRFVVTDEYVRRQGTLLIYGSLTAGSLSATEPRYATRYEYDRRLEHERPPGFPMTNSYEIESWEPRWQEPGDDPQGKLAEAPSPPSG